MKKFCIVMVLSLSTLFASPDVMGGITYNFGGGSKNTLENAGATVKVLSTVTSSSKALVGAGVSYYPWAESGKQFGVDVSAGYGFKNGAVMGGWDFLKSQPSVSLGYNKEISTNQHSQFGDGIQDAVCKHDKKYSQQ